jgi:hypothetical protein
MKSALGGWLLSSGWKRPMPALFVGLGLGYFQLGLFGN